VPKSKYYPEIREKVSRGTLRETTVGTTSRQVEIWTYYVIYTKQEYYPLLDRCERRKTNKRHLKFNVSTIQAKH